MATPVAERIAAAVAPTPEQLPEVVVIEGTPLHEDEAPNAGIEALKKQLEEIEAQRKKDKEEHHAELQRERDRADAAERSRFEAARRASESADRAHTADRSREQTELDSVTNALARTTDEITALTAQKAALLKEGEFEKVATVDVALARAAARVEALESGKAQLEQAVKAPGRDRRAPTQAESEDDFISKQSSAVQPWLRANRHRFFSDQTFATKASSASAYAINVLGLREGSPEFFKHVDIAVGNRQPDPPPAPEVPVTPAGPVSAAAAAAPPPPPPRQAPPAAPPSRSAPPSPVNGGQPGTVYLTAEEMRFCELNEIPPARYALQREKLKAEKKIYTTNG